MPLVTQIHLDAVLTNISRAVKNSEFVADKVWPIVPVKKESDVYYQFDQSNLRADLTEWVDRTIAREIDWQATRASYVTERHGLQELVTDKVVRNADSPIQPLRDSAEILAEKLLLRRELRLATVLQAVGTYPAGHSVTLALADRWDNFTSASSDPNDDMSTARSQIYGQIAQKPNLMVIPREVFEKLREHPRVMDRIKYTQVGVLTPELLGNLFDIENVLIAGALQNTANEAQADSLSFVWGKSVFVGWTTRRAALRQPSWGYHLQSQAMQSERWRDEERKGQVVRNSFEDVPQLVTPRAGYIIRSVIS